MAAGPETVGHPQGLEKKFIPIHTKDALGAIVAVNPGTGIVSRNKYNQYFGTPEQRSSGRTEFMPWVFGTPIIVDVEVKKGDVRKLLTDGHHRTVGVYENFELIQKNFPYFFEEPKPGDDPEWARFRIYDATEKMLNNAEIVDQHTKGDRKFLTMDEYLVAIIVSTIEQEEIAPKRIAAKLMLGWSSMVGDELAAKFSGLAALSFLQDPKMRFRDEDGLKARAREIGTFFQNNTNEEKRDIRNALVKLGMVIKRAEMQGEKVDKQIHKDDIAAAAFELIAESSGVLGTSEDILQQVNGLLYHPDIQHKLGRKYGLGDQLVLGIQTLGGQVAQAIKQHGGSTKSDELGYIQRALVDQRFTLDDAVKVITADEPSKMWDTVDQAVQRRIVRDAYIIYRSEKEDRRANPIKFQDLTEFEQEALRIAPFVLRVDRGGPSLKNSILHIEMLASGLQQASEFVTYLNSVDVKIIAQKEKDKLKSDMDLNRTKAIQASLYSRETDVAKIATLLRETKRRVIDAELAARAPQPPAPQPEEDRKGESVVRDEPVSGTRPRDRRSPEPGEPKSREAELYLMVTRAQRDEVYYRNHRLDFRDLSPDDMQVVYELRDTVNTLIADREALEAGHDTGKNQKG